MPDRLRRIHLAGWKSIDDATLEPGPVTVLIGANGSGKSNLIAFVRLLKHVVAQELQVHVAQCGGANAVLHFGSKRATGIYFDIDFETASGDYSYGATLKRAASDTVVISQERIGAPRNRDVLSLGASETSLKAANGHESRMVVQGLLARCRAYHFHDTTETGPLRRSCYVGANRHLYPDGGNLPAMLYLYKQRQPVVYQRILSTVQQVAPFIADFILEPDKLNPNNITLKWKQPGSDYEFGPHQLSDGSLRMIALATLLLEPDDELPLLVALDEPELGLHPAALGLLGGLVRKASHHCQVMLATQSPALVDCFELQDVVVANLQGGATTFDRLDADSLKNWLEDYSVSQLWEKNVIGGGPYP